MSASETPAVGAVSPLKHAPRVGLAVLKVGDKVRLTTGDCGRMLRGVFSAGQPGIVTEIDAHDPIMPLRVTPEGEDFSYWSWPEQIEPAPLEAALLTATQPGDVA